MGHRANFEAARGKVLALPNELPESYVSDTWLFGNVRNGTAPGLSTRVADGPVLPAKQGRQAADRSDDRPAASLAELFIDAGYDRQPDFTIGLTNTVRYKRASLSFLLDIRKGGDVFNATEHFLTARGLAAHAGSRTSHASSRACCATARRTRDTPTKNNIVVIPAVNTSYYTNISEELFIEKDINWSGSGT